MIFIFNKYIFEKLLIYLDTDRFPKSSINNLLLINEKLSITLS